jgi:hypothetical protein
VLADLCDEEIWEVVVVVVVIHHIMVVVEVEAVVVVVVETVEVHHGLHGIKMDIDPVI